MILKKALAFGAPSIVSALSRLLAVPLTTYFLGPEEFGYYAVVLGVVGLCLAVTSSFSLYVVSHRYAAADADRANVVLTCVVIELCLALICALALAALWPFIALWFDVPQPLPSGTLALAVVALPLATLWQSVTPVVLYEGRAMLYAFANSLSAIFQLVATALCLYSGWDLLSLFVGYTIGTVVTGACAVPVIWRHRTGRISGFVFHDVRRMAGIAIVSNLSDSLMTVVERAFLSRYASLNALGLYFHAQNYRNILMTAIKAISMAAHRQTLDEARADAVDFVWTRQAWALMYGLVGIVGVGAALLGREVISFITFDKFTDAAVLVPLLCILLLVQQVARPQQYKMMAMGEGTTLSRYKLIATLAATISLVLTVPVFGIFGPIASAMLKELLHRGCIYAYAARRWNIRYPEHTALAVSAILLACTALSVVLVDRLLVRIALWSIVSALLIAYFMGVARRVFEARTA